MTEKNISLEELYKMRSDIAVAALEVVKKDLEIITLTLSQLRVMDDHYKLKDDLDTTGMEEIVKTLRYYSPEMAEGKTDEEVLALYGKDKK